MEIVLKKMNIKFNFLLELLSLHIYASESEKLMQYAKYLTYWKPSTIKKKKDWHIAAKWYLITSSRKWSENWHIICYFILYCIFVNKYEQFHFFENFAMKKKLSSNLFFIHKRIIYLVWGDERVKIKKN